MTCWTAMERAGVTAIVFSSSAAVYGTPDVDLVTEDTPKAPSRPTARSKLDRRVAAAPTRPGRRGAAAHLAALLQRRRLGLPGRVRHQPAQPLPARASTALVDGRTPSVNGTDYPTPDGTCVRDYIHVADLAVCPRRRRRALDGRRAASNRPTTWAAATASPSPQIMDDDRRRDRHRLHPGGRRRGARATRPASSPAGDLAARDLDWTMRHTLADMVASAWQARRGGTDD